jgi:hypothetical protein
MLNTIQETRKKLKLGQTRLYEEIGSGRLRAKKCGRRTFVSDDAIQDFISNLEDYPTNMTDV